MRISRKNDIWSIFFAKKYIIKLSFIWHFFLFSVNILRKRKICLSAVKWIAKYQFQIIEQWLYINDDYLWKKSSSHTYRKKGRRNWIFCFLFFFLILFSLHCRCGQKNRFNQSNRMSSFCLFKITEPNRN